MATDCTVYVQPDDGKGMWNLKIFFNTTDLP